MLSMRKVFFVMSFMVPTLAFAEPVAEVSGLRGQATLVQDGSSTPIAKGTQVEAGSAIRTAKGRVKLRFVDGSVVIIGDNSVFKVTAFESEGGQRKDAKLSLDVGLVSQTVTKANGAGWLVRTPTLVTAVRGTEFIVDVASDATTSVVIRSGKVIVKPTNAKKTRSLPKLLKKPDSGVMCNLEGECLNTRQTSYDRLKAFEDRLSGV